MFLDKGNMKNKFEHRFETSEKELLIYSIVPGGVRTKTAMHYFDEFPTWRNQFVVMRAVFRVSLIIVCTTFAGFFSATILDLESSGIVK